MFNCFMRLLFALSSLCPMFLITGFISYVKESSIIGLLSTIGISVALFFAGSVLFPKLAHKKGEVIRVEGSISSVALYTQWVPTLFGSYLIPLVGLFDTSVCTTGFVFAIEFTIALCCVMAQDIPPALILLPFGYRFYELSFSNGSSGYKLITRRSVINDPQNIKYVVRLFNNDYWLFESE